MGNDRFLVLVARVSSRGLMERAKLVDESLRAAIVQLLGRIWYDFDGLRAARTRPFKSWARAERTIEEATVRLCDAAELFVAQCASAGEGKHDVVKALHAQVGRLGIFV